MEWDFSCPDWPDRLRSGESLIPSLPLDDDEAERAVAIFNKLRLPDVQGQPRLAEAAGEWQKDIVRAIFGSLIDEIRMVPEVFCMVPKKNSKTTGGAAITLTGLLMNERPRAEFIYVGPTQEVADLAFQQTAGMIEADDYLDKRFHVAHHTKTITDRRNKAKLKIKTFDMKVVTGTKPVFVLLDELHIMSTMSAASRIIGQIRGGLLPNPEAVMIIITTQSDDPPAGVFRSELNYARGVRDGRIKDARTLPIIYEFPDSMQRAPDKPWADPKNWPMVLPNLGRSITIERLVADYHQARERGDEEERRWASQHLNIEIGLALKSDRWAGADFWERCAEEALSLDDVLERSEVVVVGIDGGGLDDLLGMAVMGREVDTRKWLLWTHAWAHTSALERRKSEADRYRDFQRDGDLTIVEEVAQDVEDVADIVERVEASGLLPEKNAVGVDPVGIGAIVDELTGREIDLSRIIGISQGWKLVGAIKTVERKLAEGHMRHSGSALMNFCVGNARVEPRGNAVSITKQASGTGKIDPLMATFNAAALMAMNPASVTVTYEAGELFLS